MGKTEYVHRTLLDEMWHAHCKACLWVSQNFSEKEQADVILKHHCKTRNHSLAMRNLQRQSRRYENLL